MEITVIHGQSHKGSTYNISETLISHLVNGEQDSIHRFMLPTDGPNFCIGCFNCIYKGEGFCPHNPKISSILEAIQKSDVIIIDSPTYCFEMTGQLKTLFDHLAFMWMSHRPNGSMFKKVGVAISSAAGAGAKNVTKSIKKQMFWWGMGKSYQLPVLVKAKSYADVSVEIKKEIDQRTKKLSNQIKRQVKHVKPRLLTKLLFKLMSMMQKTNTWNEVDKNHWESQGWLTKIKPWRI